MSKSGNRLSSVNKAEASLSSLVELIGQESKTFVK